jgi:hypothetical protein
MTNSETAPRQSAPQSAAEPPATTDTKIRPYRISIPQADIDDLRDRLARTR